MEKRASRNPLVSGFTLLELIIVVVILAILSTIAFVSVTKYTSNSRDSKRVSNTALMAKGFEIAMTKNFPVDMSKTATGYNFVLNGSGLTMTGYYGVITNNILASINVSSKDIESYDGFQQYRFSYFPKEKKFQLFSTLENPDYSKVSFLPFLFNDTFADTTTIGYPFVKGNYAATGGINNILVDGATWNGRSATNGIKSFSGSETITTSGSVLLVPEEGVPASGSCGSAAGVGTTTSPTLNLCAVGTSTSVTDNGTTWSWGCSGVNGGSATATGACTAPHAAGVCKFDDAASKFDSCVFAP